MHSLTQYKDQVQVALTGDIFPFLLIMLLLAGCGTGGELTPIQSATVVVDDPVIIPDSPLRSELVLDNVGLVVAMEFAADSRLFFAEKEGGIYTMNVNNPEKAVKEQVLNLEVAEGTENGLLGLALAPDFDLSHHFYVYYNVPNSDKEPIKSRIVRFTERDNQAGEETIIVDDLPATPEQRYHFGGGLTFGPDGKLYLIFGDRNMTEAARDPTQLPGSILRYNPDGTIPTDNPFPDSPVYAYGIRNGFGLAFDPESGLLYESENGANCDDELNLILPGADYGWGVHPFDMCPYPDDTGQKPVHQWSQVVAPADLMFYTNDLMPEFKGDLLVCVHNESTIVHIRLTGNGRAVRELETIEIPDQYELCRVTLTQGPDGWIYTATADRIHRIGR
jgi:glucose/arabinose dehydrogenase